MAFTIVPINQLGAAGALVGNEMVPILQSGVTVRSNPTAFTTLASATILPAAIAAAIAAIVPVANASLASMTQGTVKGRAAGAGTGSPQDLTQAQLTALVNAFTTLLNGLVPAPGAVANKFLRDDGTWQTAGGSASFPLLAPDGDQFAPSYSFADQTGLGLFRQGDNLVITANGVIKAYFNVSTLQFNVDADVEAVPPVLVTPDDDGRPVVVIGGAKLITGARAVDGGDVVAGFNVGPTSIPTDLDEGDIWTTPDGDMFIFIDGVTKQFTLT